MRHVHQERNSQSLNSEHHPDFVLDPLSRGKAPLVTQKGGQRWLDKSPCGSARTRTCGTGVGVGCKERHGTSEKGGRPSSNRSCVLYTSIGRWASIASTRMTIIAVSEKVRPFECVTYDGWVANRSGKFRGSRLEMLGVFRGALEAGNMRSIVRNGREEVFLGWNKDGVKTVELAGERERHCQEEGHYCETAVVEGADGDGASRDPSGGWSAYESYSRGLEGQAVDFLGLNDERRVSTFHQHDINPNDVRKSRKLLENQHPSPTELKGAPLRFVVTKTCISPAVEGLTPPRGQQMGGADLGLQLGRSIRIRGWKPRRLSGLEEKGGWTTRTGTYILAFHLLTRIFASGPAPSSQPCLREGTPCATQAFTFIKARSDYPTSEVSTPSTSLLLLDELSVDHSTTPRGHIHPRNPPSIVINTIRSLLPFLPTQRRVLELITCPSQPTAPSYKGPSSTWRRSMSFSTTNGGGG
ncbi:hypothetical protein FA13DRAFT_1776326 [Coprinellus micaceus]|uniref:Uncharacterized protein n=1 Tax=Coprinellus micaceus TaxID=71717 RepID=A0A4Y7T2P4_COPMI|nr:hypothetical protein FA13DRAFT_1776326 [Coprinellus micaceus]